MDLYSSKKLNQFSHISYAVRMADDLSLTLLIPKERSCFPGTIVGI